MGPILKKLLDEVFVISRIMEVEVSGYQPSQRARLITLTETLIMMGLHLNRDCEGGRGGGEREMEAYKQQFTYADLRGFHLQ